MERVMEHQVVGKFSGALWVAGLLAVGSSVRAAENPGEYLSYSWKELAIQPQFDTSATFTDNLFYSRGANRVSDVLFTVSPGLKLQLGRDGQNQATLEYMHDETLLIDYSDFNTRQERLQLAIRFVRGKIKVEGRDNLSFLSSILGGAISQSRQLVDRMSLNDVYTVTYDWTEKTDFYLRGTHFFVDYDRRTFLLDQQNIEGLLGMSYQWTPKLRLTLEGFYGNSSIGANAAAIAGPDSQFYGGFVGLRGTFTPKLTGSVRVGYEQREFSDGASASANTPAVGADLTYQFSNLTSVMLRYDRRTFPSPQFANQISVTDSVNLSVFQLLGTSGRWLVRGTARYDHNDLTATTLPTGGGTGINVERTDSTMILGAALVYQPQPWLTCVASYEFEDFGITFGSATAGNLLQLVPYHNNRVSLSVAIGF
jgi:Putative beta-barrel porin 2